ncbi:LOW QUALITY PROTEIN: EEF1A lysine methyltransferase 1 [Bacillus rossius redtenbacheri]|uniref:LOW QUALITY PROTEIN: EEF1A lysine methyltransferase 1 n=1 Tax=Bacillus rossius redtenbacheri TaxID=93214 RepID=UPI002FDEB6B1
MCEDDDVPQLSEATMLALQEFCQEREAKKLLVQEAINETGNLSNNIIFEENWQLSQFWYDDATIDVLSREACRLAGEDGRIALISCPSLYPSVKKRAAQAKVLLLEFDRRFEAHGDDFCFYDYNTPLELPEDWAGSCDVVVADPPFLSAECLAKTARTIRFLARGSVVLCTGAVMADLAERLLGVKKCDFEPRHRNNLANDFFCFTNYGCFLTS